MTKKVEKPNAGYDNRDTTEFRRWCIEMATSWPMVHVPARNGAQAVGAYAPLPSGPIIPAHDVEADVIARADKIKAWVLK